MKINIFSYFFRLLILFIFQGYNHYKNNIIMETIIKFIKNLFTSCLALVIITIFCMWLLHIIYEGTGRLPTLNEILKSK